MKNENINKDLNINLLYKEYDISNENDIYDLRIVINKEYINFILKNIKTKLDNIYSNQIKIKTLIDNLRLNINPDTNLENIFKIFDNMNNNKQISINKKDDNNISITFGNSEFKEIIKYEIVLTRVSMSTEDKINFLFNEINRLKYINKNIYDDKSKTINIDANTINLYFNKKEDDLKNIINEKDIIINKLNDKLLQHEKENKKEFQNIYKIIDEISNKQKIMSQNITNIMTELNIFKENIKKKLENDLKNIKKENENITKELKSFKSKENNETSNSSIQSIFQSSEFNSLSLTEFNEKYKNNPYYNSDLKKLKEIFMDVIEGFRLALRQLDYRGNKIEGWGLNQLRGNMPYDPPIGWIGIGLRVIDLFEYNYWIGNNNSKDEWAVAYHGVGGYQKSEEIKRIVGIIIRGGFRMGHNQMHRNCPDINHPGKMVGDGVYFTLSIKIAEMYSGITNINGDKYKTVLMVRVKPSAIRKCNCECSKGQIIVNGTFEEVRPYRILFKKI